MDAEGRGEGCLFFTISHAEPRTRSHTNKTPIYVVSTTFHSQDNFQTTLNQRSWRDIYNMIASEALGTLELFLPPIASGKGMRATVQPTTVEYFLRLNKEVYEKRLYVFESELSSPKFMKRTFNYT